MFAVMRWAGTDRHSPQSVAKQSLRPGSEKAQTIHRNTLPAEKDAVPVPLEAKGKAVAELESTIRILEQSLSLAKTQEQIAQVALAEQRKAKQAADARLLEQTPQISALQQQLAELMQNLSTNDSATLTKAEWENLASQTARQRARFNLSAHGIWRRWLDLALTEVDKDTARFIDKLGRGMSYNEAVAEFSKLKANNDGFIEFADGNAVILANLLVAIENEMWRRVTQAAFNAEATDTFTKTMGEDIRALRDWEKLLQNSPERGPRSVQEWLRELTALQSRFNAGHFDDKSNLNR